MTPNKNRVCELIAGTIVFLLVGFPCVAIIYFTYLILSGRW